MAFDFLHNIGIRQTPTFINLVDAKQAIKQGVISYPLFIKPRWGMGSIGIYKVENEDELDVLYKKLHREIFNTYLKYESEMDRDSCIVIQQAINGQEYGIEIINDLNERMMVGMEEYISLSEFYDEIGLSHTAISDDIGWNINRDGQISIDMPATKTDKGEPCLMLDYRIEPRYDYSNLM